MTTVDLEDRVHKKLQKIAKTLKNKYPDFKITHSSIIDIALTQFVSGGMNYISTTDRTKSS